MSLQPKPNVASNIMGQIYWMLTYRLLLQQVIVGFSSVKLQGSLYKGKSL